MEPSEAKEKDKDTLEHVEALPVKVGSEPGEVEELSEEISHSGVASSEEDVERLGVPGPDTGEDRS